MWTSSKLILITIFAIMSEVAFSYAQAPVPDYSETRKLLLKMDRRKGNEAFGKLFREADVRMESLFTAVEDDVEKVSVNAQVILRYLGDSEVLRVVNDRLQRRAAQNKLMISPIIDHVKAETYLEGSESDPMKIVRKNARFFQALRFNSGHTTVRLIGYNANLKAALFELVEGQVFTSGWHVVIRLENNRWRLITDTNIWVH